jgi:hypothetical protein
MAFKGKTLGRIHGSRMGYGSYEENDLLEERMPVGLRRSVLSGTVSNFRPELHQIG